MEKINKHNYEAYFLDYLEGNLSAEERRDLFLFLDQNPSLKKELDLDLMEVVLDPSEAVFENKSDLKVADETVLSIHTVDTWMLESVEKNLPAAKQQELLEFVRKHQLEKIYQTYQATVLKPDLTVVFSDKKKLKVTTGVVIPLYLRVASVAAVGVLLIGLGINRFGANTPAQQGTPDKHNVVASKMDSEIPQHVLAKIWVNQNGEIVNTTTVKNQHVSDQKNADNVIMPIPGDLVEVNPKPQLGNDTTVINPIQPDDLVKNQNPEDSIVPSPENETGIVLSPFNSEHVGSIVTEEPYKIVTNAASNVTNREITFTRDKVVGTNEYVAYGFKIGNFEFERKKSE